LDEVLDPASVDTAVVVHAVEVGLRHVRDVREVRSRLLRGDGADLDRCARRLLAGAQTADALDLRLLSGPDDLCRRLARPRCKGGEQQRDGATDRERERGGQLLLPHSLLLWSTPVGAALCRGLAAWSPRRPRSTTPAVDTRRPATNGLTNRSRVPSNP